MYTNMYTLHVHYMYTNMYYTFDVEVTCTCMKVQIIYLQPTPRCRILGGGEGESISGVGNPCAPHL